MKTKIFFTAILLQCAFYCYSQELNKKINDSISKKDILIGMCNTDGLRTIDFTDSYNSTYEKYRTDVKILEKLDSLLKLKENNTIKIKVILGTWCGDSKEHVPGFIKIFNRIKYNPGNIELICVDRNKKAGNVQIEDLNIDKVPTFIIYRNNQEIGRIVESPTKTLEKDVLEILLK